MELHNEIISLFTRHGYYITDEDVENMICKIWYVGELTHDSDNSFNTGVETKIKKI